MSKLRWLGLWLLPACSAQPGALPKDLLDAGSVQQEAGRDSGPARGLDASVRDAKLPDADRDAASSDAGLEDARDTGIADASAPLVPPEAAAPCGDDLGFVGGLVRPELGPRQSLDAAGLDLEKLGKFPVLERELSVPLRAETRSAGGYQIAIEAGTMRGTVYGPANATGSALAEGRFPLLIGAPGFQASYADYAGLFRHFASHGFVVLGVSTRGGNSVPVHDKEALETSQAISFMLDASPYREQLDGDKVAAAGHSKGGKVSFFAAALDPRIDLVFGWDPSNAGGPPCGAIADLTGSDCNLFPVAPNCLAVKTASATAAGLLQLMRAETFVFGVPPDALTNPTPEHNSLNFYRGAPSPASLVYLEGGHGSWVESGGLALATNPDIIRVTKAVQTAKMLSVFYGATGLTRYLPGGDYLAAQGARVRQVASK